MPPQRKPQTADEKATEALDRVTSGKPPIRRTLDFLLENNEPPQTLVPEYSSTQVPDSPKVTQQQPVTELLDHSSTRVPEYQTALVPESRFYKKPNEVADALDRHLTGAESKVYEHLWRLTVGFGRDRVQIRVSKLCERAGYRSMKTVRVALFGLESKGLIMKLRRNNDPLGDEYVMLDSGTRVPEYQSTQAKSALVLESKNTQELNTVFKDQDRSDDEPLAAFTAEIIKTVEAITGKRPTISESERWRELAEVLMTELRIAAGRTTVSSVPAFLAEHLRRRLWKKEKRELEAEAAKVDSRGDSASKNAIPEGEVCPDCFNTGMYYPEGFEKGVARCTHLRLTERD